MNVQDIIYAGLNRNTNAFIFARDMEQGTVLFASHNFESIFEIPINTYYKKPDSFLDYVHEEDKDQVLKNHQLFLENKVNKDEEFRIVTPKGKVKWLWSRVFYMKSSDLGNSVIIGIAEDITHHKNVTDDLCDLGELAHDLRSPLNSILGLNKILEVELAGNKAFQSYFEHIEKSCKYGLKVIEEALTYTQVKNKSALNCEVFETNKFFREVIDLHGIDAEKLGISLELKNDIAKGFEMVGDRVLLLRALSNLVTNALKFTPPNGTVKISIKLLGEDLNIKVADNGIGIPDTMSPYMFERFSKAKRTGLHGERSDGIGLYNVKNIVNLHGGNITFESKENEGTTFDIVMPTVPEKCEFPIPDDLYSKETKLSQG